MDELIFDAVLSALLERPRTTSELLGFIMNVTDYETIPRLNSIQEVLDILDSVGALQFFKSNKHGEQMKIYTVPSQARCPHRCELCSGTGVMDKVHRGLCPQCHGNGMYTPDPLKKFYNLEV